MGTNGAGRGDMQSAQGRKSILWLKADESDGSFCALHRPAGQLVVTNVEPPGFLYGAVSVSLGLPAFVCLGTNGVVVTYC